MSEQLSPSGMPMVDVPARQSAPLPPARQVGAALQIRTSLTTIADDLMGDLQRLGECVGKARDLANRLHGARSMGSATSSTAADQGAPLVESLHQARDKLDTYISELSIEIDRIAQAI